MSLDPHIASRADCVDALLSARRVKNILLLLLLVMLVGQMAVFAVARFTAILDPLTTTPTQPAAHDSAAIYSSALAYVSAVLLFGGVLLSVLLVATLWIQLHILLSGRVLGVAPMLGALFLSLVLLVLMFPWQTLLNVTQLLRNDFVLPGVLYTWREIRTGAVATPQELPHQVLYWFRFFGAPVFAMIILLLVQLRSGRSLQMALGGESSPPAALATQSAVR